MIRLLQVKRLIKTTLSLLCVVFVFPGFAGAIVNDPRELKKEIGDVQTKIEEIEKEVLEYRKKAFTLSREARSFEGELQTLSASQNKLVREIQLQEKKIDLTNLEISELTRDVIHTEDMLELRRALLVKSIKTVDRTDEIGLIEFLVRKNSLAEYSLEVDPFRVIQDDLRESIRRLRLSRLNLAGKRTEEEKKKQELYRLKEEIADREEIADSKKKEAQSLISKTRSQEKSFQSLIKKKEKLKIAFEQELFAYESQLEFLLDPTVLPRKGSAPLSWPLREIFVTQRFGKTINSSRLYASGSHSGVDFRANYEPVYAMASGIVVGVGDTDIACRGASFGKWILMSFDNNLAATYGHLSKIKVKQGQRITQGQLVGYTGNSGRSTGPHLHLSLYAGVDAEGASPVRVEGKESRACKGKILIQPRAPHSAYLDAINYFPPISSGMYKYPVPRN